MTYQVPNVQAAFCPALGCKGVLQSKIRYERKGIDISLDGCHASPLQIVTAYMTREEGTYMRDYVMGCEGNIEALRFTDINNYDRAEITP